MSAHARRAEYDFSMPRTNSEAEWIMPAAQHAAMEARLQRNTERMQAERDASSRKGGAG